MGTTADPLGAGTLLERSRELAALSAALAAVAESGDGRLALVRGEAGAGKTSLLRRFCDEQSRAVVLWGACDPLFTPRPLGPFLDIAPSAGGELARAAADGAPAHRVAALLLGELAGGSATVLVLEDVHWVDEATLDVLRLVLRRLDGVPALVVLSYRDDELDRRHPLRTLLGELSLARPALRLDVEALSAEAVAAMAESLALDPDDLFHKTAGNPFFVTEVLAAPGTEIPETLRDAVLARAARLSEAASRLLETVALLPPHVELRLLETLAPGSAGSLEECLTSGMLRAEPGRVVFRHELARLAIEESLPPDERLELHRQALAALGEPPGGEPDLARVAYHAEQAGDGGAVRRFAPAAAEHAASVGAHREAADQYARALRFIGPQQHAERARLLELMATEDYLTDRNPEAIEALDEALEHYRALGDERGEGNALRLLAGYLWCPGRIAEAEDAGRRAVSLLERLDHDRELGDACGAMAFLHRAAGGGEEALLWSRRTHEIAERLDDEEFRIAASAALGEAEVLAGEARGYERFEHALALAERKGLPSEAWIALGCGVMRLWDRSYAEADRLLAHAFTYSEEHGFELFRQYAVAWAGKSALEQGRWAEAADRADEVLRRRRASTTPTIIALCVVGQLRVRRGDPDPWSPLNEAAVLAETSGELPRVGLVAVAKAEAAWLEGRPESVAPFVDPALELARGRHRPWLVGELALWRRRGGAVGEPPGPVAEPYALQLAGEHEPAAELWARIGCPYDEALALADSGAEAPLRAALERLQELGAAAAAALVMRRLRALGARGIPRGPRPSTRSNPAHLTARELEVLALLADRLRNSEIASRLFLSVKTVDHHVASILRKLGVRTRADAAAASSRYLAAQDR